jgi:hypothetical protein
MQTFLDLYDQWNGLIPFVGGIYATLLAYGYLPKKPKDPEKMEVWRQKFGPMMKILSPLLMLYGAASLLGGQLRDDSLDAKVRELNRTAPRMLDQVTKFERAIAGPGQRITFEHTVSTITANQVSMDAWLRFTKELRQSIHKNEENRRLLRRKVTLVFRYTDANGALLGELEVLPDDPPPPS